MPETNDWAAGKGGSYVVTDQGDVVLRERTDPPPVAPEPPAEPPAEPEPPAQP